MNTNHSNQECRGFVECEWNSAERHPNCTIKSLGRERRKAIGRLFTRFSLFALWFGSIGVSALLGVDIYMTHPTALALAIRVGIIAIPLMMSWGAIRTVKRLEREWFIPDHQEEGNLSC
jgi:hypothetical protein